MGKSIAMSKTLLHIFIQLIFLIGVYPQDIFTGSIVDAHIHNGLKINDGIIEFDNLEYFSERGIKSFYYALPVDRTKTNELAKRISKEINQLNKLENDQFDINYGIEYFYGVINGKLANIDLFHKLGIKYITLIDNEYDEIFSNDNELSDLGKQVIEKMNAIEIKIDISHLNCQKALKVIKYSNAPVIASHSCTFEIANITGNLCNSVIDALKENNGFVMVSFNKVSLFESEIINDNGIVRFVNHIDYLKEKIGIDKIGIGTDYQANGKYVPNSLDNKNVFNAIYKELVARDYTDSDISKVFGENLINLFAE